MVQAHAASNDILLDVDKAGVAVVTLNKPRKKNAISFAMWQQLGDIFTKLRNRADIRVVILTGAGGNFSAGADISEFPEMRASAEASQTYSEAGRRATQALRDLPQPTIAAVHGYGVGGGCGLALACDLRVGDQTTQMGIPAAKRGIVYSLLDTENLLRAVGLAKAKLVLFSGRTFPLADCRAMGLIDELAERGALAGAMKLAAELAERAPLSQRGAKLSLEALARGDAAARAAEIAAAQTAAANSEDYREATQSFLEKRRSVFQGR